MSESHQFVRFAPVQPHERGVRDLAVRLMNLYAQANHSRQKWLKRPPLRLRWALQRLDKDQKPYLEHHESHQFSLSSFESHLGSRRGFDHVAFNLPDPNNSWLDATVDVAPLFHVADPGSSVALTLQAAVPLGPNFPLMPRIDREGRAITTFQAVLLKRVAALRNALVVESEDPRSDEWFQAFRTLTAECVSLIDATLHQLYFKAKYDPAPGWRFDPGALGARRGQRLSDKLKWVRAITGRDLDARDDVLAFKRLKRLRNHLQHFDPPCFCYAFEDAVGWLNDVHAVARLNLRIRDCVGAHASRELIALLLQPRVEFVPPHPERHRLPQPSNVGYGSVVWPACDEADE